MPAADSFDTVLVVDFGAQYAQLIARRVREAHVYSEIVPRTMPLSDDAGAVARRASSSRVVPLRCTSTTRLRSMPALYDSGVPVLGICYGAQLVAQQLGGEVRETGSGEYGRTELTRRRSQLGAARRSARRADRLDEPRRRHRQRARRASSSPRRSPGAPVAALEHRGRGVYGVQFHPEVAHTERGQEVLKRFLFDVCDCRPTWTNTSIIEQAVDEVRAQVGSERLICGLSGGVDSAVAAALVHKAIGDQLTCVFVDNGLLRLNEAEQVEETFRRQFAVDLVHVKAADRFLGALDDVIEPEQKRKIIGETFIRVFEEAARDLAADGADARFLVQGTLYPDIVESGGDDNATIKSHHNVGGLPDDMNFELVEPLRAPVQGRGARDRRGARPARGDRVAPAVPGPRAWRCASSARSRPSGSRSCATPTRS